MLQFQATVAVVAEVRGGWEIQLWQGDEYDVEKRRFVGCCSQRGVSGIIPKKETVWEVAQSMAYDLDAVDVVMQHPN